MIPLSEIPIQPADPASAVGKWLLSHFENVDPAGFSPGAAPGFGLQMVPQATTFNGILSSAANNYLNPDEAYQDSLDNTELMLKDLGIANALEARKRMVALLPVDVEPEDSTDPHQRAVAAFLLKCLNRIPLFTHYRYWLQDAIWTGRAGIQNRYAWVDVGKFRVCLPKPRHHDDNGWKPINGDKFLFRNDLADTERGQYADQCGIRVMRARLPERLQDRVEATTEGDAIFLKPWERDRIIIHKHDIQDADFNRPQWAGRLHGVGLRNHIYREWWMKQECLAFLLLYLERSAGGTEIYTYPDGDADALAKMKQAAKEKQRNNVLFFPRPVGDDAALYDYNVVENGITGLDAIKDLIQGYFNPRMTQRILGQTLTTEAQATGLGSGVADAHLDTLQHIINFDARCQEETLTSQLLWPIQMWSLPETCGQKYRVRLQTDDDDAKARLESIQAAFSMGCRVAEAEVLQVAGLRTPKATDRILGGGGGGMPQ